MRKRKRPERMVRRAVVLGCGALFVLGLGILCYPAFSSFVNARGQARAVAEYTQAVRQLDAPDYAAMLAQARAYNARLAAAGGDVRDALAAGDGDTARTGIYWDLLDPEQNGVMGCLCIEKIGVELPIYHGIGEAELAAGAGHLPGSSLPVGGAGTHAVLAGHTGLAEAALFTRVDELRPGDTFTLQVVGQTLTYQVDQILTVLPDQVEALAIQPEKDYVTLVTCTPYGINDHRLLVRGVRVENQLTTAQPAEPAAQGFWQPALDRAVARLRQGAKQLLGLFGSGNTQRGGGAI